MILFYFSQVEKKQILRYNHLQIMISPFGIYWRKTRMANLSQQKRQRMLTFLNKLKEEHKDDDSVKACIFLKNR